MGAMISMRDCETRLGVSKIENGNLRELQGYIDADYARDFNQQRSTWAMFTIADCVINWKADLQDTVALSTSEAEYMAVVEASKEGLWLKGLVETFGIMQNSVRVHCDS